MTQLNYFTTPTTTENETQYPVLTYGTLRPGCGNYLGLLAGNTVFEQTVTLPGYAMYGRSGFPYCMKDEDNKIVATLNYIDPEKYSPVMRRLDQLEGYRGPESAYNHYTRELITFEHESMQFKAYIYLISGSHAEQVKQTLPLIEHGDWLQHVEPKYW